MWLIRQHNLAQKRGDTSGAEPNMPSVTLIETSPNDLTAYTDTRLPPIGVVGRSKNVRVGDYSRRRPQLHIAGDGEDGGTG